MHRVIEGDARDLRRTRDNSISLVIADPPYGIAKSKPLEGSLRQKSSTKMELRYETLSHDWDLEVQEHYDSFTLDWMIEARRVLSFTGSLMVCISFHRADVIRRTADLLGFKWVSTIVWAKTNAAPSITRRQPTASTELIIWFCKSQKGWMYDYEAAKEINEGKQLRDFWVLPALHRSKSLSWRSQKPVRLFENLIRIASKKGDRVLDPFLGTGTTVSAAHTHGRCVEGYERHPQALDIVTARLVGEGIPFQLITNYDRIEL